MDAVAVIDIKDSIVVRAVAGKRNEYQAVESRILKDGEITPLAAAAAFYEKLGIRKIYIADLDAILGDTNNIKMIKKIKNEYPDLEIILDAAFDRNNSPIPYLEEFLDYAVIATETIKNLSFLNELKDYKAKIIISMDLKTGSLIHNIQKWQNKTLKNIVNEIKKLGFQNFIILDLANVGTASGISKYIRELKIEFPELNLITGGGVKDYRDIKKLKRLQFSGVLIASAFHNGSLGEKEVRLIEADDILYQIAWCITGAGHLLRESIDQIEELLAENSKLKIDIYLSKAGLEVLKIYKFYQRLENLGCQIYKDNSASSPIIGKIYKGYYDALVSAPTTSNTTAKFVLGISDTLVSNLLAHAGKTKLPVVVLPTDIDQNLVSAAPGKEVDVFPREIDLKNTEKLSQLADTSVISEPKEVKSCLKKYF
ncbi:HisA/HisF-related TIM barrel protein [Halanaerobium congolense]|jgi:HisA/HisF family protein|uniref:HisA/HisF-related TIM barrel protein n=1 Tax=Halanaerobium congolense TaxID=54121 RepID=UPI000882E250|nr:HisA/HisF-related TIM barrel protein [Halanaerobium congolense]SDK70423.1 hisA/hisF family protein [Halanaerobium congolense]SDM43273.1 hisA/hisF family protein [Halanaerobium congolense]